MNPGGLPAPSPLRASGEGKEEGSLESELNRGPSVSQSRVLNYFTLLKQQWERPT